MDINHAPSLEQGKKVDKMSEPTELAQSLFESLNEYHPEVSEELKKEFEGLPILGPYEHTDIVGGTYLGQYKNGLKHGFGKCVSTLDSKVHLKCFG